MKVLYPEWSKGKGKSMSGYFMDLFWKDYIKTSRKHRTTGEKTGNKL